MTTPELVESMIRFRPVTADVGNVNRLVEFLEDFLRQCGVHTERQTLGSRRMLYAATCPTRRPDFLFNAHLDVVPAAASQFEPRIEDGQLVGRGAWDCLGNCAILAQLLRRTVARASVGVMFSTDEETGGETTHAMVAHGYRAGRLIIIVDGDGYALVTAQKGVVVLILRAHGDACHAAEPWLGRNAIDLLLDGYQKVRHVFPTAIASDQWQNTLAATMIHAGTAHNRVPETAEMTVNIRFTETDDASRVAERIRQESGLTVEVVTATPPVACDSNHREVVGLRQFMQTEFACNIPLKRLNGATDARHFVDLGVPVAIIGIPGRGGHGEHETVELAGLAAYEEMLVRFVLPRAAS